MTHVSIIIPTYNRADLIKKAIQSVLNQTYKHFEIIVVDDGSSDNTKAVVQSLNDSRIRYLRHDRNKGEPAARNTGIQAAQEEWIAFQDSDDEWMSDKLEKQVTKMKNASPKVGVVYTGFWRIKNDKKEFIPSDKTQKKEGDIHKELLRNNFIGIPTTLVRKECFEKAGMFDESLSNLVDWEMWLRISRHFEFLYIHEPLMNVYLQPDSITVNQPGLSHALETILKGNFSEIKGNNKLLGIYYLRIGAAYCMNREMKQGRKYFIKAFHADRYNLRVWPLILFSYVSSKIYTRLLSS